MDVFKVCDWLPSIWAFTEALGIPHFRTQHHRKMTNSFYNNGTIIDGITTLGIRRVSQGNVGRLITTHFSLTVPRIVPSKIWSGPLKNSWKFWNKFSRHQMFSDVCKSFKYWINYITLPVVKMFSTYVGTVNTLLWELRSNILHYACSNTSLCM